MINGQVGPLRLVEASKERFPRGLVLHILLPKELPLRAVMLDQQGVVLVEGLEPDVLAERLPLGRENPRFGSPYSMISPPKWPRPPGRRTARGLLEYGFCGRPEGGTGFLTAKAPLRRGALT